MLYSIVVPVYKVEKYLDRCVESLIGQTYRDIEIILVDDGSPDACPEICDKYAALDSRVRVIHKENGGLSDARNFGIDAASGEYVIFVDSDDYIDLDTCERLEGFASGGVDVIIGDALVERGGEEKLLGHRADIAGITFDGKEYLKRSLAVGKAPMAAVLNLIRRDFLNENSLRFKKGILHEDERFTPEMLLLAKSVVYSGESFYHYIVREGSITTAPDYRRNVTDLYNSALELREIYLTVSDKTLQRYLLDSLVSKYLTWYVEGRLHAAEREYTHKRFVLRNAKRKKTVAKAWLFAISPKLYYKVNCHSKKKN